MYQDYIVQETSKRFIYIFACDIFCITLPNDHLETNNLLINLLKNEVKNVSSILNCYIAPKCVSSKNITKTLSLHEDQFSIITITRPENNLWTNL